MTKILAVLVLFLLLYDSPSVAKADSISPSFCLAEIMFFETRDLPIRDKLLVGNVVLNRRDDERFSNSICELEHERGQFPWIKIPAYKRRQIILKDLNDYILALYLSVELLDGKYFDNSHGSLFFRNPKLSSKKSNKFFRTLEIVEKTEYHVFYKFKD